MRIIHVYRGTVSPCWDLYPDDAAPPPPEAPWNREELRVGSLHIGEEGDRVTIVVACGEPSTVPTDVSALELLARGFRGLRDLEGFDDMHHGAVLWSEDTGTFLLRAADPRELAALPELRSTAHVARWLFEHTEKKTLSRELREAWAQLGALLYGETSKVVQELLAVTFESSTEQVGEAKEHAT